MSSVDSVGQNTAINFSRYAVCAPTVVSLAATGNAVVALPVLSGGMTANTGSFIVRTSGSLTKAQTFSSTGGTERNTSFFPENPSKCLSLLHNTFLDMA